MLSSRKQFLDTLCDTAEITKGKSRRVYKKITEYLHIAAQTKQFGEFLTTLNSSFIDKDYQHVLKYHINDSFGGNFNTKEATFNYFKSTIMCDIGDCSSHFRNNNGYRALDFKQTNQYIKEINDGKEIQINDSENEDINKWILKQRYIQTTLDTIHEHLVHYEFNKVEEEGKMEEQDELGIKQLDINADTKMVYNNQINTSKYITDSTNLTKYGFGIDHYYPSLRPIYSCIKHELIKNKLHQISIKIFNDLLVKAVNLYATKKDDNSLKCSHYKQEYNIVRNEHIAVRHILALAVYTDMSGFCSAFRSTYRKTRESMTEIDVTKNHREFYFFGKALFEAIQFYGEEMKEDMEVLHGIYSFVFF